MSGFDRRLAWSGAGGGGAVRVVRRVPVAILGGSGYGGGELLRLLGAHPGFEVTQIASRHHAGRAVHEVHRGLLGLTQLTFGAEPDLAGLLADGPAFLVSALPAGEGAKALGSVLGWAAARKAAQRAAAASGAAVVAAADPRVTTAPGGPAVADAVIDLAADWPDGLSVIDLGPDLRPGGPHASGAREALFPLARYGLVELNRAALEGARLVANPGCFATALQLAIAPLVATGLRGFVAADGATGSSGSGALPSETTHHPRRHSDYRAYRLEGHAHVAEVQAQFADAGLRLSFVAHSAPFVRGIFVTVHAPRESFASGLPAPDFLREFYRDEPLVRVRDDSPRVLDVAGTAFCDLSMTVRGDHVVVCAALDNLGKGMAAQAVQNMNLLAGYPETTGLLSPALGPV
ncbi:MAG: N-acetyl-gamma-glutamyl-phosphate reductase [Candidatus Eisenbacteria bacterium]|nr:N-acetyl-gamma-glutamyl-phosphate reductase [Candidatus Eisenbacteria bacterium]